MNPATDNAVDNEPVAPVGFIGRNLSAKTTRSDHLDSLLRSIDATLLIFFGIGYYSDNLTFLLVIRASSQALYARATQLAPTLVANIICIVAHILHDKPEGTTALRNYLHGGLICDFVGELGPISRTRLLLVDAVVLCLQLTYLAISHELQTLKSAGTTDTSTLPQDLESEEAGLRRDEEETVVASNAADGPEGIELQPMLPTSNEVQKTRDGENGEDMILTLDIRKSLSGLFKKNRSVSPVDSNASRLNLLYDRVMAARAAAARA